MSKFDVFAIGAVSKDVYVPYSQRPAEYTYLDNRVRMGIGGGAITTPIALAKLGMSTAVAGSIGKYSGSIRNMLERNGVRSFLKRCEEVETAISVIAHYQDGRKRPIANIESNMFYTQQDLKEHFKHVRDSEWVLRTGYPWMPQIAGEPTVKLFEHAKQHNVITALDMSNPVSWEKELLEGLISDVLPKTDLLCANERELCVLARREDEPKMPKSEIEAHMTPNRAYKYARRLLDKGVKTVNLHYGPRGTMIITNDSRVHEKPPKVDEFINPTGSGNLQNAGFIYCILNDKDLRYTAKFANAIAVLRLRGREFPTLQEVEAIIK